MDKLQVVQFDVRGTRPENRVLREKIPIKYKDCPWIVPNGSPYFAEDLLVTLYNEDGGKLKLGTDYWFEGKFVPFCEITGRNISSFVKLSDKVLAENTFVSMTYQSIGAWFVPRNSIDEWVDLIYRGKIPIPWSKVFNVPPTLPSSKHGHTIKTEIGDWYELTFFFDYLANYYSTRDPNVHIDADRVITESFAELKAVKAAQLARLNNHDKDYALPHQTTKFQLDLGNLDNYRTATFAQDRAGNANNLFSTPGGVLELSELYAPDTSNAMRNGVLPISYFGGESFIPPVIDGSFEGLGSVTDSTGICLEPNGLVMLLTNHYDGRTEGLYYSIWSDYNKPNARIRYTSYKYEPPVLKAQGIEVNRIICGSGNKVIMTGQVNTNNWFIALTNNSFDPSGHWYSKVDMTDVIATRPGIEEAMTNLLMVHHMGDYLVLVFPTTFSTFDDRYSFFRVKTDDVRQGLPVKWERFKVSYRDFDDNSFTNQDYFVPARPTYNGSGSVTKFGPWTFPLAIQRSGLNGRRASTYSAPNPNNKAEHFFHLLTLPGFYYDIAPNVARASDFMGLGYRINPATGVMTKLYQPDSVVMDFGPNPVVPPVEMRQKRYYDFYNGIAPSAGCSSVMLYTGEMLTAYTINNNVFPTQASVIRWSGFDSDSEVLSGSLEQKRLTTKLYSRNFSHDRIAPIPSGGYPAGLSYEPDGEVFGTVQPGRSDRAIYYRQVSGGYQVREGIDNLNVPSVRSRPLTNNVYMTNLHHTDGMINITGGASELAAGGVECGGMSLSVGGWSSKYPAGTYAPQNFELRAPPGHNALVTFPRTYARTLNNVSRTAIYKSATSYGFTQALINKVKTFIPAAHQNTKGWSFSIYMLNGENGNMFVGLNFAIIQLHWLENNTSDIRMRTLVVTTTVEAPNAAHPGVYMILDFAVSDQSADFRASGGWLMVQDSSIGFLLSSSAHRQRPIMQIYREGGRLKIFIVGTFAVSTLETATAKLVSIFDVVLATRKLENMYAGATDWSRGDVIQMVPRVGMTDVTLVGTTPDNSNITVTSPTPYAYTGGAATLFKKTVGSASTFYLTASAYPETGWVLYLQDQIPLMVSGTRYRVDGGSIDLRDIDPDPRNKTFWLYITVEDDKPRYLMTAVKLRESGNLLLAAVLTTNEKQILTITRYQPFVISDYKLSYIREGGIIPVSSGFPQDDGIFRFLKSGELLP